MKTYNKIYSLGNKENSTIFDNDDDVIVIEEKVDGANFRFMYQDGKLTCGTRTQDLVDDGLNKNFKRAVEFVQKQVNSLSENDKLAIEGLIFFCENMVKHTIGYNWDITPSVIGYDICQPQERDGEGIYVDEMNCKDYFNLLNIEFVPIVKVCLAKECRALLENLEDLVPTSKYITMKAEGIVFKNYSKQIMAKFVRKEFKEKNEEVFGKTKKKSTNDEEWMTAVYCNNYKIEKAILFLIDLGEELSMEMMHRLPEYVYNDIFQENWREIIKLDKTINFKKLKSFISKRCVEVLKLYMINSMINKKDEKIKVKGGKKNGNKKQIRSSK